MSTGSASIPGGGVVSAEPISNRSLSGTPCAVAGGVLDKVVTIMNSVVVRALMRDVSMGKLLFVSEISITVVSEDESPTRCSAIQWKKSRQLRL